MKKYFQYTKHDFPASIVVFLVALPLCLGIALASGVPLLSGLISGIVGGIVVGLLSKSPLSVSGPAAGLVVIVLNAQETLGTLEGFMLAVLIAGLIQLILGFAKAGVIGLYFPTSVIKGMLAAIGIILIMKQLPYMIGVGGVKLFEINGDVLAGLNAGSLIIGVASLGLLLLWRTSAIQNIAALKAIPGAVAAVVVGVGLSFLFKAFVPGLALIDSQLVSIPILSNSESLSDLVITPDFSMITNVEVYITAVTLAIVASLETLLSVEAVDKLDPLKRRTPTNAELKAQGVGNMVCGMIGGLPITAVIVRSSTNVDAGARTKMSAIYHGILLVLAVAFFPVAMNTIPLASLAAILVLIGYKLARPALWREQFRTGRAQFVPFATTIIAILVTDLLIGIIIGMVVGAFYILRANYKVPYFYHTEKEDGTGKEHINIRLSEHVSFLNKARLQLALEELPAESKVVLDGTYAKEIDHDALEVIHDFKASTTREKKNIDVTFKNIPELVN